MTEQIDLIRAAVDADVRRRADARGQMAIGELAAELKAAGRDKPVYALLADKLTPVSTELTSYRGYYDQIAILPGDLVTAPDLADALTRAIGEKFYGYKGGAYTMSRNTPVWVSEHGDASAWAVTGVSETEGGVLLHITLEEW